MPDYVCAQFGHHWHEADGAIFDRPRKLAYRDVIDVHCCQCAAANTKTGYGARNPVTPNSVACGEFVTL